MNLSESLVFNRLFLGCLAWCCFFPVVRADLLTYQVSGTVRREMATGIFQEGRPYVFTFTLDTGVTNRPIVPERGDYLGALKSFTFDYDSGIYAAQGSSQGGVNIWDGDRGLYDHIQLFGLGDFPPVGGQNFSTFSFFLTDTTATAFADIKLPRELKAESFQLHQFQLAWGFDFNTRYILLSVDALSLVARRPEITGWRISTNELALTIELPDQPATNVLERCLLGGASNHWEFVAAIVSSGGRTNWTLPLQINPPAVLYRLKPQ